MEHRDEQSVKPLYRREEWVRIKKGFGPVYDSNLKELGNVDDVTEDYLLIRQSPAFGRDIYIPNRLVHHVGVMEDVMLRVPVSELEKVDLASPEAASQMKHKVETEYRAEHATKPVSGPEEWVRIQKGWKVYDSDRREIGGVQEVAKGHLVIRRSTGHGQDLYVPDQLVHHVGILEEVMLRVPTGELEKRGLFSADAASKMVSEQH
jgi:hypothetical protein